MPLEQTITIVNNSGKIITSGKHLISLFKEAKASYQDKKAQLKSERSLNRAQTFDTANTRDKGQYYDDYYHDGHYHDDGYDHDKYYYDEPRRRSYDDGYAYEKRSKKAKSVTSRSGCKDRSVKDKAPLTERNLKTLSEVSRTAPSKAPPPMAYQSPYCETLPHDMAVSKMNLTQYDGGAGMSMVDRRRSMDLPPRYEARDPDMDLAYGNVPPDLASRYDLDPAYQDEKKKRRARDLVRQVEGLLDEAHCLQHSATTTISRLQQNPDAAAAVALSLAELSSAVAKISPAFLSMLKGGSPAVFALLASPQFLIGTGIAVGVTVVMFGGWKIVKKVREAKVAREALAYEGVPMDRPAPLRAQTDFSTGIDEAVVLEDELSTIESWRRGIPPSGMEDSADLELITPEAQKASRKHHSLHGRSRDDADTRSRRSTKTSKSHKSSGTTKARRSDKDVPERKSSKNATGSVAGSDRSRAKKTSPSSKKKERVGVKAIEDGRSTIAAEEAELNLVLRPSAQRQSSNMLKAIFKNKKEQEKEKEKQREGELVLARRR